VVPDLAKAREFFTGVYGAKELPEATSRVLPGEKELRFTTGATVFNCWAPKGERESDTGKIPDVLGFRYVTHNVRDTQALHDALAANGDGFVTLEEAAKSFSGGGSGGGPSRPVTGKEPELHPPGDHAVPDFKFAEQRGKVW
jgi:catechol 2,3-dioxygenase-like lactoylglutathione lyase family enzyme